MIINARCAIFAKTLWKLVGQRRSRQHGRNKFLLKLFERPCCRSDRKSRKKPLAMFQLRFRHRQPLLQRQECLQRPLLRSRRQFYLHLRQVQDRLAGVFYLCSFGLLWLRILRIFRMFFAVFASGRHFLGTRVRG